MKKYLLVLAGLYCVLSYALAEHPDYPELKKSDANIIGHVLDKKTKEHLPYITIALKGTTIGTVTDATGHYFLKNLPEGKLGRLQDRDPQRDSEKRKDTGRGF